MAHCLYNSHLSELAGCGQTGSQNHRIVVVGSWQIKLFRLIIFSLSTQIHLPHTECDKRRFILIIYLTSVHMYIVKVLLMDTNFPGIILPVHFWMTSILNYSIATTLILEVLLLYLLFSNLLIMF